VKRKAYLVKKTGYRRCLAGTLVVPVGAGLLSRSVHDARYLILEHHESRIKYPLKSYQFFTDTTMGLKVRVKMKGKQDV